MPQGSSTNSALFFFLSLLIGLSFAFSSSVFSEESINRESTIKAGLILKFSEFIQWPEYYSSLDSEEPLNICIRGKDKFEDIFDHVNDHDILRRNILIRRSVPNNELKDCHFLFINILKTPDIEIITRRIKNFPVLVVTETEKLSHPLVAINFRTINNRIRFEINLSAFNRSGIIISSELLNLAFNVLRID